MQLFPRSSLPETSIVPARGRPGQSWLHGRIVLRILRGVVEFQFAAVLLSVEGLDGGFLMFCPFADFSHIFVIGQVEGGENSVLFGAQVFKFLGQGINALGQLPFFSADSMPRPGFSRGSRVRGSVVLALISAVRVSTRVKLVLMSKRS